MSITLREARPAVVVDEAVIDSTDPAYLADIASDAIADLIECEIKS